MEGGREMSDTPETDAAWEELCCTDLSWYRIAEKMKAYCQEKERERDEAREALEHIVEYWNRDENETSMSDALWHIIQTAVDVLHATKPDQLKKEEVK